MPFAGLLFSRSVVHDYALDGCRIRKIGHMRIVEGDVTVLAETDKCQVERRLIQQLGVALNLGIQILCIAPHILNGSRMNFVFDTPLDPKPEAGGMGVRHADILIQVEDFDGLPRHARDFHKRVNQFQLRVAGSDNDTGPALYLRSSGYDPRGIGRGRSTERGLRRIDSNLSRTVFQNGYPTNCGTSKGARYFRRKSALASSSPLQANVSGSKYSVRPTR
jgi:hypothetical protein